MSDPEVRLVLKAGREKAARQRHPWVYSGSIETVTGPAEPGALADLLDAQGEFVARGYVNRGSRILFRALTWKKEPIDRGFFVRRIELAAALRRTGLGGEADAFRLLHGEGDGLPGLIADVYAGWLVMQIGSAGMERLRETALDALLEVAGPRGIWERSEGPARREEGLEGRSGLARGEPPPERIAIQEQGVRYAVDVRAGLKTGFYLDQRPARARIRGLAAGRSVLDVFSCSGGFAVAAALGGAREVTAVDSSAPSLKLLGEHLALNGLDEAAVKTVAADAFRFLREAGERYELIVVDPPPFAKRKAEVEGACRGYKDVNLHAMKRLAPGGFLLTASCSHHIDPWLFQQVLFGASRDAGRSMQILERRGQPLDHPVSLNHPEGEYLKVFLLRALD